MKNGFDWSGQADLTQATNVWVQVHYQRPGANDHLQSRELCEVDRSIQRGKCSASEAVSPSSTWTEYRNNCHTRCQVRRARSCQHGQRHFLPIGGLVLSRWVIMLQAKNLFCRLYSSSNQYGLSDPYPPYSCLTCSYSS